nr:ubiquitin carboxyl-terminal hydrolase 40-like [Chrysemys picta bellii]
MKKTKPRCNLNKTHLSFFISEYKLGGRTEICIEPLQKEENLGPSDLLLRVQMGIPGERDYYHSVDLVWDISKECTAWALRHRLAAHYSLPVEKIEIAKYFPEKFEWMTISSWVRSEMTEELIWDWNDRCQRFYFVQRLLIKK